MPTHPPQCARHHFGVQNLDVDAMGASRPLTDGEETVEFALRLTVSAVREVKTKDAGITKGLIIMKVNDREMTELLRTSMKW